jgi:hypothetical protein
MKILWRTPFLCRAAAAGVALLVARTNATADDTTGSNPRAGKAPSSVGTSGEYEDCKQKCFDDGKVCGQPCETRRCLYECVNKLKACLDNCEVSHH